MRPKKTILVYCSDPDRRAVLSTVLTVRGYRVIGGISEFAPVPDLALIVDELTRESENIAQLVDELAPREVPILVLIRRRRMAKCDYPSRCLFLDDTTAIEQLLEQIRVSVAKRRPGPKTTGYLTPEAVGVS